MVKFNGLKLRRIRRKKGISESKTEWYYVALEKDNDVDQLKKICGKGGTCYISSEYSKNGLRYIEYKKVIYYLKNGEFMAS